MPRRPRNHRTICQKQVHRQGVGQDVTQRQSFGLMKNLISSGIASIAHRRGLFEEDCFRVSKLQEASCLVINPHAGNKEAALLVNWLEKGVYDALAKRYLESLTFSVLARNAPKPEDCDILESYEFKILYPKDGKEKTSQIAGLEVKVRSGKNTYNKTAVIKATKQLMRKLVVFASTLKPLPHDRFLSMRLTYRDDVTPEAYEPQFFQKAKESLDKHCSTNKVTLGNVATEFHSLDLTFQSSPGQTQRPASQGSEARTPAATIPPENSGPRAGGSSRLDSSRATSAQRSVISPDLSDFAVDPGAKKLSRSEYIRIVDIIKNIGSPIVRIRDMRARVRREINVHLSTGTIRRLIKNNVLLKLNGSLAGAFKVLKRTASSSKAGRKGPASMSASDRAGAVSRLDSRATPRRSARLKRKASTIERPIVQNQRQSKRRAPSHPPRLQAPTAVSGAC